MNRNFRYDWASRGDVNAFFGLMLDNVAGLALIVSLLAVEFGFPADFALAHLIPGTALGVLAGDLFFTWLAFRLARRTGRKDLTAMPLGLDTPSTFGMIYFVLGPAFLAAQANGLNATAAADLTWKIGACAIIVSGLFKLACAPFAKWVQQNVPRAGLLGSLAAIALVLISFLPLLEIFNSPLVGLPALAVILMTLVARIETPLKIPGALAAILVGVGIHYVLRGSGWIEAEAERLEALETLVPTGWLSIFPFNWSTAFAASLVYLPVTIPFALATVVGGIDCTESAAVVGDEYDARTIIGGEGMATLLAGLCGGVIQTTPYIGHPAYKAMGGRAAYTLATALFIGGAGILGYFGYIYAYVPKAALFPILVFIGLEISAQSFLATPRRHFAALAFAVIPAVAALVMINVDPVLAAWGKSAGGPPVAVADLMEPLRTQLQTIRVLSGGFILTSLLWASVLASIIDRRLLAGAFLLALCSLCSAFGVIHSPLSNGAMLLPWQGGADYSPTLWIAGGYAGMAIILLGWQALKRPESREEEQSWDLNPNE